MSCQCRKCVPSRTFRTLAPRLARARDQLLQERVDERRRRARAREELLQAERLLAHRELQYVRAGTTRDPKYLWKRAGKLKAAQQLVEQKRRAAA